MVEAGPSFPTLILGEAPGGQHVIPLHAQPPSTPAPAAFAPATPGLANTGLQSVERSTGQRFGSVCL